ncbi:MAG TPA: site-specific integrase, partial [Caldisericia bacterium]|nr:site-specific integrase [Caldisericia bacterium]
MKNLNLFDIFLSYIELEKEYSKNTISSYKNDLDDFKEFLTKIDKDPIEINKKDIFNYLVFLSKKKLKPASLRRKISALRSFYKFLIREELIENDPTIDLTLPKRDKVLPDVISIEEIEKLINIIPEKGFKGKRDRALIELLYSSGLRVSEIINLKINEIDLKNGYLKCFGKGSKERIVPFGSFAKDFLIEYIEERDKN